MSATDAKKSIQEMTDYSQKWHDGISTRSKSSNTSDGLVSIQAQLNNLGREIKKVNERVYDAQFGVPFPQAGRYRAAASGYQRDNENTSYQERRQTMEELLNKLMVGSAKRHDEHSSLIKEIQTSTDAAIRNQGASIKALKIQIRQMSKEDDKMPSIELIHATISMEVLKKLKKLQVNSTESATSLRRLPKEKSRIEEEIKATMKVNCTTIIKDALPPKEKDPGSFNLPCSINNMCFDKALELDDHEMEDLDPEIEDGEIIDEPKVDIVKIRI
ncbi:hypothetical protein Tco_0332528 [Tanacetum coccineum]